jgi:DNA-binding CsgD family transcriptional regulator
MKPTFAPTPTEREVQRLHARGKAPDIIAIRLGMKISRVLSVIASMAKA